ncbi:MAG: LPS assembly lipoprotein LptE [Gammaproteobacteria bacterium]
MNQKFILSLLLSVTLPLAACGFQLLSDYSFPSEFGSVYVESRVPTQGLIITLMQGLDTRTTKVVQNRADATAVLRIISASFNQRTLSFDSRGRPREFELSYIVEFDVTTDKGEFLPKQSISLTRDYEFDGVDISAGGNQREIIRRDLEVQMARSILRRIAAQA